MQRPGGWHIMLSGSQALHLSPDQVFCGVQRERHWTFIEPHSTQEYKQATKNCYISVTIAGEVAILPHSQKCLMEHLIPTKVLSVLVCQMVWTDWKLTTWEGGKGLKSIIDIVLEKYPN